MMTEVTLDQVRNFRLHSHHLATRTSGTELAELAGACGFQNTPPGSWETALYNRLDGCSLSDMRRFLYEEKSLLQSWSLRGAPYIFPASQSGAFLCALIPREGEPWIYTAGIRLALDYLGMSFQELFESFQLVLPYLDEHTLRGKNTLDQTLAGQMTALLSADKRGLWQQPSMYKSPDKQTVGGAVVSFLLRPAAFCGLIVFANRSKSTPSFTSYRNWTGSAMRPEPDAAQTLVRKYLHCYGPSRADSFADWLGCSGRQGRRMWALISEEIEPVSVVGKQSYILSADKDDILSSPAPQRELLLLGPHDPYLDQRDRETLQPDPALQKRIWKWNVNPGAVVYRGEIIGIWTSKQQSRGVEIQFTLWKELRQRDRLNRLAEEYASFRGQELRKVFVN